MTFARRPGSVQQSPLNQPLGPTSGDPRGEITLARRPSRRLFSAQSIYDVNYKVIPLLIVASIWYLAMTSVLYVGQYFIERRFGRGFTRAERATMRARWLTFERGGATGVT
jgi:hypothetical protein